MNSEVTPGWQTTEFWAMVGQKVVGLLALLVFIGIIPAGDKEHLSATVAALVMGVGYLVVNGVVLWRYISSRQMLKMQSAQVGLETMKLAAVEQAPLGKINGEIKEIDLTV